MNIHLTCTSDNNLILPIHHNHILQAFIYNLIDEKLAAFLHNVGFMVEKRTFRLFVFSRLQGNYRIDQENQTIDFGNEYHLSIASPLEPFCISLCAKVMFKDGFFLGDTVLRNMEFEVGEPFEIRGTSVVVYTKSPMTAYSTLLRPNGAKYTAYFQPGEADFNRIASENLRKKYESIFREPAPQGDVLIQPLSQQKLNIIKFKDFIIKGYSGKYRLSGPSQLLQMALDAGIGSKNSQGFGYIELLKRRQ